MNLTASISALHVGKAAEIQPTGSGEWWDKPWQTGFYKQPQTEGLWLGYEGFRGDEQADRRYHGGSEKAVCVYAAEHYPCWRNMLALPDLAFGAFGENLTTTGITESTVCIGDVFSLGEACVQISQPRQPCWKLARRWRVKDLAAQVEQTGRTGFYFRVLQHGHVQAGDALTLLERTSRNGRSPSAMRSCIIARRMRRRQKISPSVLISRRAGRMPSGPGQTDPSRSAQPKTHALTSLSDVRCGFL